MTNIETAFAPLKDRLFVELMERFEMAHKAWVDAVRNFKPVEFTEEEMERYPAWSRPTVGRQQEDLRRQHYAGARYTTAMEYTGSKWMDAESEGAMFHREFAEKEARIGADARYNAFIAKFLSKLGDLDSVKIEFLAGADCIVKGKKNGHDVVINQQTVWKENQSGTIYPQFPARIYVDGQFTPASKFEAAVA